MFSSFIPHLLKGRVIPGNSRGYAAVTVLMVALAMFLLGTAALTLAVQHRQMAVRHYHQTQAYYIAEAGVQTVLADRNWLNDLEDIVFDSGNRQEEYNSRASYYPDQADRVHNLAGGTFIVKVARQQDYIFYNKKNELVCHKVFHIYSTGACAGSTRVLVVKVRVPPDGGPVQRITWREKYPLF